jgi:hypothetical protein
MPKPLQHLFGVGRWFIIILLAVLSAACPSSSSDTPPAEDPNALVVTTVVPANNANGVLLNSTVSATFSEALNPAALAGTVITVNSPEGPLGGIASLSSDGQSLIFTPASLLVPGTSYTARVRGGADGVKSVTGKQLSIDFVWQWSTGAPDITAPTVTSTVPVDFATGVCTGTAISAVFSETMDPASIDATNFSLSQFGSGAVPSNVSFAATTRTATLTPVLPLQGPDVSYTVTIRGGATGVKDASGNPLAADRVWSFVTDGTCP